ncbi:biotin--[acetyl-CoA-carboxylase] ligase [Desulfosediminicola sp.]|uniref:biotin--[acetyl-CoA-carboxylase] ligase n=1 Tax=Desulfosediminicola sp. TaxID=2886825 RepID=UPI003AF21E51
MKIVRLQSTDSTNRVAMEMAADGAAHGTAIISATQTKGRGRLGKVWQSPAGKGLYTSVILRPVLKAEDFPYLTFVAGLAVADAIKQLYNLQPGLKWPNDIYFFMKKCGGILSESSALTVDPSCRFAVVGIGLNVNTTINDFPAEVVTRATSLFIESGREMSVDEVFTKIHAQLLLEVQSFERHGFTPVIKRWRELDCMFGKRLAWVAVNGKVVEGISLGPDNLGRLHIRDDSGKVHEVLSGDVQLGTS